MSRAVFLIVLLFTSCTCICQGVISDEECFAAGAKRVIGKLSQSDDTAFREDIAKYEGSAFLTSVRYCLGPDASRTSQDFLACILSLSICPRTGMEIINWQLCACDTVHCIIKRCAQQWVEQWSITGFSCLKPCLEGNSTCIMQQTGSMGETPTALPKKASTIAANV